MTSNIREKISEILNTYIPEGKWNEYLGLLDRDGHPNRKELLEIIVALGKAIEELQAFSNSLQQMPPSPTKPPQNEEINKKTTNGS